MPKPQKGREQTQHSKITILFKLIYENITGSFQPVTRREPTPLAVSLSSSSGQMQELDTPARTTFHRMWMKHLKKAIGADIANRFFQVKTRRFATNAKRLVFSLTGGNGRCRSRTCSGIAWLPLSMRTPYRSANLPKEKHNGPRKSPLRERTNENYKIPSEQRNRGGRPHRQKQAMMDAGPHVSNETVLIPFGSKANRKILSRRSSPNKTPPQPQSA